MQLHRWLSHIIIRKKPYEGKKKQVMTERLAENMK